jgi:hypothetical protein
MQRVAGRFGDSRRGRGILIVLVVVVLLAAGGGAAWWFVLRSTPEMTVEAYLAAAKAGDQEKVKSLLSSETVTILEDLEKQFGDAFSKAAGAGGPAGMPVGAPDIEMQVGKASVQGDTATVPLEVKMGKAQMPPGFPDSAKISVDLVREGGQWKIDLADQLKMAQQFAKAFGGSQEEMQKRVEELQEAVEKFTEGMGEAAEGPAKPPTGDAAALVKEGLAAKKAGQLDKAVSNLEAAIAQEPDNVDAHWGLAWVLADQDKNQEAISHFKKVVELTDNPQKKADAQAAIERLQ